MKSKSSVATQNTTPGNVAPFCFLFYNTCQENEMQKIRNMHDARHSDILLSYLK